MAITVPTEAYCEASDVQALTGRGYSTTSKPTTAQVEELCKQRADLINAALAAAGWTTPISTGARSLNLLQSLNARGAAAEAESSAPGATGMSARATTWREEFELRLRQLRKGELDLPDATKGGDTSIAPSAQAPSGEFNLDTSLGTERAPTFARTTVW